MDYLIHFNARLAQEIASLAPLQTFPLTLIDVGCSGGLHQVFERFGAGIVAHGFDPVIEEVERLNGIERRPNVRYHGRFVGVPADHPFLGTPQNDAPSPFVSWYQTSAAWALELTPPAGVRENRAPAGHLADFNDKVVLDDFLDRQGIDFVDFLKIDVDGADLEVLHSAERMLKSNRIGAIGIEIAFFGSAHPRSNTFHNIDRFLRTAGMELMNISVWRYSMRALPGMFRFRAVGETTYGPPLLGDAVYFNPAATGDSGPLSQHADRRAAAVLKQAALMDLFGVPDCAARVLLRDAAALARNVDTTRCLDALVQPQHGAPTGYHELLERFETDMSRFFPQGAS